MSDSRGTYKWFEAGVGACVDIKVGFLVEALATALHATHVLLLGLLDYSHYTRNNKVFNDRCRQGKE